MKALEEPASFNLIKFVNEELSEFIKAAAPLAGKYNISEDTALIELLNGLFCRFNATIADKIIERPRQKSRDLKILLLDIEHRFLKVGQKIQNTDIKQFMLRILKDNDTFVKIKELLTDRMDIFEKTTNDIKEDDSEDFLRIFFHLAMDVLSILSQAGKQQNFTRR